MAPRRKVKSSSRKKRLRDKQGRRSPIKKGRRSFKQKRGRYKIRQRVPVSSTSAKRRISFRFANYWINQVKWKRKFKRPFLLYSTYGDMDLTNETTERVYKGLEKEIKAKKNPIIIGGVRVRNTLYYRRKKVGEVFTTIRLPTKPEDFTYLYKNFMDEHIKELMSFKLSQSPKIKDQVSEMDKYDNMTSEVTQFDFIIETTSRYRLYDEVGGIDEGKKKRRAVPKSKRRKAKVKEVRNIRSRGKSKKRKR